MQKLVWMFAGAISAVVLSGIAALVFLKTAKPSAAEAWLARSAREFAMPSEAKQLRNPVPRTPEVLADALAHWADHCASCHANNGSGDTPMGQGMYPPAPDMRQRATQGMSDGELFYVIENGIRFTGMPGWGSPGHDGKDSWKLVHFIRHLPELSFEERREMERLTPKGPDELEEERQQEEFLKGESKDENHTHSH